MRQNHIAFQLNGISVKNVTELKNHKAMKPFKLQYPLTDKDYHAIWHKLWNLFLKESTVKVIKSWSISYGVNTGIVQADLGIESVKIQELKLDHVNSEWGKEFPQESSNFAEFELSSVLCVLFVIQWENPSRILWIGESLYNP